MASKTEEIYEAYKIREFDELKTLHKCKSYEEVKKKAREYRADHYMYGWLDVLYALGYTSGEYPVTVEEALFAADKPTADKTADERLDEYIEDILTKNGGKTPFIHNEEDGEDYVPVSPEMDVVFVTESHRTYNQGGQDAAEDIEEENASVILKRWDATLDDRTRDTHYILHGTEIPLKDYFESVSGDKALAPGGFVTAEENANCRCILTFREIKA